LGRQTHEIDALGHIWQSGYDVAGRRVWRIDANGAQTNYAYDGQDRGAGVEQQRRTAMA